MNFLSNYRDIKPPSHKTVFLLNLFDQKRHNDIVLELIKQKSNKAMIICDSTLIRVHSITFQFII